MKSFRSIVVLSLFLIVNRSYASSEFGFMGAGTGTCGEFAHAYAKDPLHTENFYFSWALGLMSGYNGAREEKARILNAMPIEEQMRLIRNYCNEHPLEAYMGAVTKLYFQLPLIKPSRVPGPK